MTQLLEAAKLHEQKTEESIDGTIYTLMGHIYDHEGNPTKSKQAYQQALEIYKRVEGEKSESVREVAEWLAELE